VEPSQAIGASDDDSAATSIDGPGTTVRRHSPTDAPIRALDVGEAIGRYVVLEELGHGAMGRVLRAYDPKLQREVALKEVHGGTLGTEGSLRLVAEARAMAKLSHPHVVSVYDVEEVDDRLVVVMEYVAGPTLRAWQKLERRRWQDVVHVYLQAGRGLAAAHAAELLHRDFKPDNVLMSRDGAPKVTDFGLAKVTSSLPSSASVSVSASASASHESASVPSDLDLTQAGIVMGTPRYMAPEQHTAEPLTAAADQYAFCVALWEALWGAPPFPIRDYRELAAAKYKGPPAPPETGVPRPIVEALRRGLSPEAKDRFPSMAALLEALSWEPSRRRQRLLRLTGGLCALGLVGVTWWLGAAEGSQCTGAEQQLAAAWGEERREQVHGAILGIGASYATTVWEHAATTLDDYAASWAAMYTEACEATTVRGEQSSEVMDLRMACLHRARVELEAVTRQLADADADVVSHAHELTGGLRPLDPCADVDALRADVEPPLPDEREAVERIRARLAESRAARSAGRPAKAKAAVDAARAELADVEHGPTHTEVLLEEGAVHEALGEYAAAETALRAALQSAAQHWQLPELGAAASALMNIVGVEQRRMAEGMQYHALAMGLALGDPVRESDVHNNLAGILFEQADLEGAEAHYRRTLELRLSALGPEHREVAAARNNLANTLGDRGTLVEAEAEHRRALALREAALRPDHPHVVQSRSNLAQTLFEQGKYHEAEVEQRRALALLEAARGPDDPGVAHLRITLANALLAQANYAESEAEQRRALAVLEPLLGPTHPTTTIVHTNLAVAAYLQKKHQEAEAMLRPLIQQRAAALGADHPEMALLHDNLGLILEAQGKHEDAEAEHRRAWAVAEPALGPEHPQVVFSRHSLATTLLSRGRAVEALPHAEFAWSHRQGPDVPPVHRAESAFVLARALVAGDGSAEARGRARGLAEQAIEGFEGYGELYRENVDDVRKWLAKQRGR
jgi:tetratricopeptide (TPR) repeat protein